ncbi:MAG: hypothetical protein ACK4WC_15455 [Rubrimonas sp.]
MVPRLIRARRGTDRASARRGRHGAEFNAKVAPETIRGEPVIAGRVGKHGVRRTLIGTWRRQAINGRAGFSAGKAWPAAAEREREFERLHAKVGQPSNSMDAFVW